MSRYSLDVIAYIIFLRRNVGRLAINKIRRSWSDWTDSIDFSYGMGRNSRQTCNRKWIF